MKRKKVLYGYIANDTARKASFKKRRAGLLKKVEELSTLCGIPACGIVYGPNEDEPVFWPSRPEVEELLKRYEQIPDMEKSGKKLDQESYLKERNKKLEDSFKQIAWSNKEMEMNHFLHQIHRAGKTFKEFSQEQLLNLRGYMEEKYKLLERRRQFLHQAAGGGPAPAPPLTNLSLGQQEMNQMTGSDPSQMDPWLINMSKNNRIDAGSSSSRKDKAVLEIGGSSSNQPFIPMPRENVRGGSDLGQPHGQPGGAGTGQGLWLHHGETGGGSSSYPIGLYHENPEGINFDGSRHAAMSPHGDTQGNLGGYGWNRPELHAGGFNSGCGNTDGYGLKFYNWNTGGTESGHSFPTSQGDSQISNTGHGGLFLGENSSSSGGYGWMLPHGPPGGTSNQLFDTAGSEHGRGKGISLGHIPNSSNEAELLHDHVGAGEAGGSSSFCMGLPQPPSSPVDMEPYVPFPPEYNIGGNGVENAAAPTPGDKNDDWPNA